MIQPITQNLNPPHMLRLVAYCRVSTNKDDQLNSLEAQRLFFAAYAKSINAVLVRIYADEGISGLSLKKRTEFLNMMSDAEQGLFDMVVVKDVSRFARNTVDLLQSVRRLKALGIETQFLTANMTSMGPSEFLLTMYGAIAQEESANTSKRVKFGKKINAEKGRVPNLVYGYDKTKGILFDIKINEHETDIMRQMFNWYTNYRYGDQKIAKILNQRGELTKRKGKWNSVGVAGVLKNPLCTGKIINGKQEVSDFLTGRREDKPEDEWFVTDRPDLRIIDPEIFEEAQRIRQERLADFKIDGKRESTAHLFSTVIKCKECGKSFRRRERKDYNTYIRWICSMCYGFGDDNCANKTKVSEPELIAVLNDYFRSLLKDKQKIKKHIATEFIKNYKANDENANREVELKSKIQKLDRQRTKYMDMYTDDLISREELNEKLAGSRDELKRLEYELQTASGNLSKGLSVDTLINNTFRDIESITNVENMSNAQIKKLIEKIEVSADGTVDIHLRLISSLGLNVAVITK
ncbi:MAG: recombinase family protein [Oscillospiraceae bacterium]|jgi:DNA invertase Pin-like site-specific DNA recombinase|nr:recombinase family protein [Oscillospiraceae bacterium]